MNYSINKIYIIFLLCSLLSAGCINEWDNYSKTNPITAGDNLFDQINKNPELSTFSELLIRSGYNELLSSSGTFTVWAPNNESLSNLNDSVINDSLKLRRFVANHIAVRQFPYRLGKSLTRVKTLADNFLSLSDQVAKVNDINYIEPFDIFCKNGVLHVIDNVLIPKYTIWEYVIENKVSEKLKSFIAMTERNPLLDPASKIVSYDPVSGKPIYDSIKINRYLADYAALNNPDSAYTYFIITDDVFKSEYDKYVPYCSMNTQAATDSLTSWLIYKDLAVRGKYSLDEIHQMGDTLISVNNVKIPVDINSVVNIEEASNGIIYTITKCDTRVKDKICSFILEGEDFVFATPPPLDDQAARLVYDPYASGKYYLYKPLKKTNSTWLDFSVKPKSFDFFSTNYNIYMNVVNSTDELFSKLDKPRNPNMSIWISYGVSPNVPTASNTNIDYSYILQPPLALFNYNSDKGRFMEVKMNGMLTKGSIGNNPGDAISIVNGKDVQLYLRLTTAQSINNTLSFLDVDYIRFEPILK